MTNGFPRLRPVVAASSAKARSPAGDGRGVGLFAGLFAGLSARTEGTLRVGTKRALIAGAFWAGALAAYYLAPAEASRAVEPDLERLLHGMALLKAALCCAIGAVLWWRVARPIKSTWLAAYCACMASLTAADVLIWQLAQIVLAAVLFHAGLLAIAALALLDDGIPRPLARHARDRPQDLDTSRVRDIQRP